MNGESNIEINKNDIISHEKNDNSSDTKNCENEKNNKKTLIW